MSLEDALCRDKSHLFFTSKGEDGKIKEAKRICNRCPVRRECWALCTSSVETWQWGIWCGTTPNERRRMSFWSEFGQKPPPVPERGSAPA